MLRSCFSDKRSMSLLTLPGSRVKSAWHARLIACSPSVSRDLVVMPLSARKTFWKRSAQEATFKRSAAVLGVFGEPAPPDACAAAAGGVVSSSLLRREVKERVRMRGFGGGTGAGACAASSSMEWTTPSLRKYGVSSSGSLVIRISAMSSPLAAVAGSLADSRLEIKLEMGRSLRTTANMSGGPKRSTLVMVLSTSWRTEGAAEPP
mmetsp:Transcript_5496/g.13918  ORF Transcript_5496/g.13918 Transcript_5496/m.13918 type:complete len:206 (-) Transcript_5496:1860-2477(-)